MGGDYANVDEFARNARVALRKIATLYPDLKLGELRGGIRIEPESLPAITPRPTPTVEQIPETPPFTIEPESLPAITPQPTPTVEHVSPALEQLADGRPEQPLTEAAPPTRRVIKQLTPADDEGKLLLRFEKVLREDGTVAWTEWTLPDGTVLSTRPTPECPHPDLKAMRRLVKAHVEALLGEEDEPAANLSLE